MTIKKCETCKKPFESNNGAKFCKISNEGKCKKIADAKKNKIRRAEKRKMLADTNYVPKHQPKKRVIEIDPKWLSRGNISGARVYHNYNF